MTDAVIFSVMPGAEGAIGKIVLNRPQQLNVLNLAMCEAIHRQLVQWAQQAAIKAVIIAGSGERAFCAGGDVRMVYEAMTTGKQAQAVHFFQQEYALNQAIFEFPKPYISFLDGITMGGGVGLSIHGSHVIATERLVWAMPETRIGFFPDVGTGYHLVKLPHYAGYYLALTGERITAADAYQLGLAQAVVSSHRLIELENTLLNTAFTSRDFALVTQIIAGFHCSDNASKLAEHFTSIQEYFSQPTVEVILSSLQSSPNLWCQNAVATSAAQSPLSLKVTLEHLHYCQNRSFTQVIAQDLELAQRFVHSHDFPEGIRAAIVDKDHKPAWSPAALSKVTPALLKTYLQAYSP